MTLSNKQTMFLKAFCYNLTLNLHKKRFSTLSHKALFSLTGFIIISFKIFNNTKCIVPKSLKPKSSFKELYNTSYYESSNLSSKYFLSSSKLRNHFCYSKTLCNYYSSEAPCFKYSSNCLLSYNDFLKQNV